MKVMLASALFLTIGLSADGGDRDAITKVIAALNDPVQRPRLLTKDVDTSVDFNRLIDLHLPCTSCAGVVIGMNETWREMTVPRIVSSSIRFITPNVAIVDGASTIRRAVTLAESVPLLFVLKKEGAEWRINAVRRLAATAVVP